MAFGNDAPMSNTSEFQRCCKRLAWNTARTSGISSLLQRASEGSLPHSLKELHLNHCKDVWKGIDCLVQGTQQDKQLVRRRISHQQQVIWGVSIVRCHAQSHHALQEFF